MLIDDDVLMIKYLKQLIKWEDYGVRVVASSYSSVKALGLFEDVMPDIVITDIGLPQINGLELVEKFRSMKPDIRVIFLTCHEDFSYAQRAINLDADNYLIKDSLTTSQLEECVRKSVKIADEKSKSSDKNAYNEILTKNNDLIKLTLLERLIKMENKETLLTYANSIGIRWEHSSFLIGIGHISYSSLLEKYNYQDYQVILYSIYNIAEELAKKFTGITVFNNQEYLVFLINFQLNIKYNVQKYLRQYLTELYEKCNEVLNVQIRFIYNQASLELDQIGVSYKKMIHSKYDFYYSESTIENWNPKIDKAFFHSPVNKLLEHEMQNLLYSVKEKDEELLEKSITAISMEAKNRNLLPLEMIELCSQHIRKIELQYGSSKMDEDFYTCLRSTLSFFDTLKLFKGKIKKIIEEKGNVNQSVESEPKLKAINSFIADHLSENISSVDVAEFLYMNSSYFSRYFKRLTGENFTDYIHRYKIEAARKMLEYTEETIEEVALKCGYSERTYFSKVFKKYMGMTPRDFRLKVN